MATKTETVEKLIVVGAMLGMLYWCLYNYFQLDAYKHFTGKTTDQLEQMLAEAKCKSGTCELVVKVEDKHLKCGGNCCGSSR